jgi:hypothetical protein
MGSESEQVDVGWVELGLAVWLLVLAGCFVFTVLS